jgi:hypothetical protein
MTGSKLPAHGENISGAKVTGSKVWTSCGFEETGRRAYQRVQPNDQNQPSSHERARHEDAEAVDTACCCQHNVPGLGPEGGGDDDGYRDAKLKRRCLSIEHER